MKRKDPGNKKLMSKKEPAINKVFEKRTKSTDNYASHGKEAGEAKVKEHKHKKEDKRPKKKHDGKKDC